MQGGERSTPLAAYQSRQTLHKHEVRSTLDTLPARAPARCFRRRWKSKSWSSWAVRRTRAAEDVGAIAMGKANRARWRWDRGR